MRGEELRVSPGLEMSNSKKTVLLLTVLRKNYRSTVVKIKYISLNDDWEQKDVLDPRFLIC
jgi:hypothetical protein